MAGITELRQMRKRRAPRLLVIQAASGAGKSSFLRAGLWPRLSRDPDFAPLAILRPALGIMTGPDGLGRTDRALVRAAMASKARGRHPAALADGWRRCASPADRRGRRRLATAAAPRRRTRRAPAGAADRHRPGRGDVRRRECRRRATAFSNFWPQS